MDRAAIASGLADNDRVFESIAKAIEVLAAEGGSVERLRARHLVLRASLYLQLDEIAAAESDVRLAREINPGVEMSAELEALL
jgi:hypothetical protein